MDNKSFNFISNLYLDIIIHAHIQQEFIQAFQNLSKQHILEGTILTIML